MRVALYVRVSKKRSQRYRCYGEAGAVDTDRTYQGWTENR